MNHKTIRDLLTTTTLLICLSSTAEGKVTKKEVGMSNADKIIAVVMNMSQEMEKGNLDQVMKAYEAKASLVAQPGIVVSGAELKEAMNEYVTMKPKFSMPMHEVIESGDIALHISPWTMSAIDPTGKEIKQTGFSLAVLRKQASGEWLIVIDNPYGGNLLSNH